MQQPDLSKHVLEGVRLLVNGSEIAAVPAAIVEAFQEGDRLLVLPGPELLHVPRDQSELAAAAVTRAAAAFRELSGVGADRVTRFFEEFARALKDNVVWERLQEANAADVAGAEAAGRSTTRLTLSEKMRDAMTAGLLEWRDLPSPAGKILETTQHRGWRVDHTVSPLGIVAFVFEGRPNVFADASGVIRSGNTAIMRIGRDALGTARAIMEHALAPALRVSGLPEDAVVLLDSREHAAGWALFSDARVSLAIARGSGAAVRQLGAVARQAGIPASLHGTGGAWMIADDQADSERFYHAVFHSLDRKVCNTLNTICLIKESADLLGLSVLQALQARHGQDGNGYRLHLTPTAAPYFPRSLFETEMDVLRAEGPCREMIATPLDEAELGREWEWERTPEISVTVAESLDEAIALFNRYSPQFIASLISEDRAAQDRFFAASNAPFVGDGFTRWVDGQYALNRPELGLSNWQSGRLLGRSGILTGDGIYTVRLRVHQQDPELGRN